MPKNERSGQTKNRRGQLEQQKPIFAELLAEVKNEDGKTNDCKKSKMGWPLLIFIILLPLHTIYT